MMKRRHFLQFTGSAIATLSLNYLDITQQGDRYAQVLAQNTPRKLALLVGINKYPSNKRFTNLSGCVTDVKLQEELLVHRFGFNRNDIVKLTTDSPPDYQPNRKNILKIFEEHLINQAKPGDVVVFHFSGHGSRLRDPNPLKNCNNQKFDEFNSTLVVADEGQNNLAPDIMGRTLFLLRSALKTDNVTMVLDSCHSGGGTRGNLVIRSVPGDSLDPLPEEIAYQKSWMKQLGLNEEELKKRRCAGVGKGVVIASAKKEEDAADAHFDGFYAGAFTYFLTQYLWQNYDTVGVTTAETKNTIKSLSRQVPVVDGDESKPIYFISSKATPSSDAVITNVNGEKITLWLGGVEYDSLTAFQAGASFAVVNDRGQASGKLKLISPHNGLVAEAKLVEKATNISLQPGTLLQESSRVIPADLKLTIGLDPSLAKETSTAQAALSKINRIQAVPAQQGNLPYPNKVQYILSRMTADYRRVQKPRDIPAVGSIGLFTEGLELVSQSFAQPGETITVAVSRLEAKIKSLLATFIIKKTLNTNSSQLDVEVVMNLVEKPNQIIARTATLQAKNNHVQSKQSYPNKIPLNKLIQFQVINKTSDNLYIAILLVDSSGDLVVAFPYGKNINDNKLLLQPSQTLVVGQRGQMELQAVEKGSAEALVIASRSPLKKAVKAFESLAAEQNRDSSPIEIGRSPVEVISDLLDDLRGGINVESREVKVTDVATLSISFDAG